MKLPAAAINEHRDGSDGLRGVISNAGCGSVKRISKTLRDKIVAGAAHRGGKSDFKGSGAAITLDELELEVLERECWGEGFSNRRDFADDVVTVFCQAQASK